MSSGTVEVPCAIGLCKSSGAPYGGRRFLVFFLLQSGLKKIARDALYAWIRGVEAAEARLAAATAAAEVFQKSRSEGLIAQRTV